MILRGVIIALSLLVLCGNAGARTTKGGASLIAAATTPFQIGSRFNIMGHNGFAPSNGTNTTNNSQICSVNSSGATANSVKVVYGNWYGNATNEVANANAIKITASVIYPTGTYNQVTWDNSTNITLAAGQNISSDTVTLTTPIPNGSTFCVRTFVSVPSGSVWPTGYLVSGGELSQTGVGLSDATLGGTITNDGVGPFGPLGVAGISFTGTHVPVSLASLGDSIFMGSGDQSVDTSGNVGWIGRSTTGQCPYYNSSIAGQTAQANQPANYKMREQAFQLLGITHVISDYSINDVRSGTSAATTEGYVQAIWNDLNTNGFKVLHTTMTVNSNSTDSWVTTTNQTVTNSGFTGGTSSQHYLFNTFIKTTPSPIEGYIDANSVVENNVTTDDGLWKINVGWTNPAYTQDGLHPYWQSNAGGVVPLTTLGASFLATLIANGG